MDGKTNPMQQIRLEKVVLNMGIGSSEEKLDRAKTLIKKLTGREAAYTKAKKRRPEFGIRKDQIIGAVVTLRGDEAAAFLKRALEANDNLINPSSIANNSVNFGVKEYIYFSGIKYDPKIGMLGLNVNAVIRKEGPQGREQEDKEGKRGRPPTRT